MKKLLAATIAGAVIAATAAASPATAAQESRTFYWISHGSPADPVWTYFLAGAEQWAADTGYDVNTSFHSGDVPSQQEAVRTAIAAGADGIVTTSPDPGSLVDVVTEANEAGIPVINFNTPDPDVSFDAYVGDDQQVVGTLWAQYLVDNELVAEGDFVWMPVEVPGASYGVLEEQGIATVFEPLGITWEVTDSTLDQAEVITRMTRLPDRQRRQHRRDHRPRGLGHRQHPACFDQAGFTVGDIPVVGWGNSLDTAQEVIDGYVNAAMWQDPQATSYLALSMAAMAASGIPPGFDITTGTLYESRQGRAVPRDHVRLNPYHRSVGAASSAPTDTERHQSAPSLKQIVNRPEFGPFILLVAMIVVFYSSTPPTSPPATSATC